MEGRKKVILRCNGESPIILITKEQDKLLRWLYCNDFLNEDATYDYLEDAECIEI